MLFFLCALFVPICTSNHASPIPPCRDVCFGAKAGCESVIERKYNQSWPVDCNRFPVYDNDVCISPRAFRPTTIQTNPGRENRPVVRGVGKSRECSCKKKTKMRLRKYVKANFDYVIRTRVDGTTRLGTNSLAMTLTIIDIIKNKSQLRLRVNSTFMMFSEHEGCDTVCPIAKPHRQYVIACHEIVHQSRLVFDTSLCMISRWKPSWQGVLEDWERIIRLPDNIRRSELRSIRTNERQRQLRRSAPRIGSQSDPE